MKKTTVTVFYISTVGHADGVSSVNWFTKYERIVMYLIVIIGRAAEGSYGTRNYARELSILKKTLKKHRRLLMPRMVIP